MRIINTHVHMIELEKVMQMHSLADIPAGQGMFREIESTLDLIAPDKLISQMDEAGVAKSVLFACECPVIYASNEYVANLCRQNPERLMGFASVDPKKENAVSIIEDAVKSMGMKGLKFHPPLQNFYPNDKIMYRIYEKATALNIPVVFHVGSTPFAHLVRIDQANPLLLDEIAVKFPQLKIVLTHLGTLWHNEAFMVVEKNTNVYIDTAAYVYEIPQLLTLDLIERLGPHKFIFGTDYPTPFAGKTHRMKDFVDCILGLKLPEDIKEGIFSKNFEEMLKK